MVPETLSRQTRQTRLALLLFSTAAICLWAFGGEIVADEGVSLFGTSFSLDDVALHTTFLVLICYLWLSFLFSSLSDKMYAGTSPSESDISGKISRLKDSKLDLEKTSRIDTTQCISKNRSAYITTFDAVNKIYQSRVFPERYANLLDRAFELSSSNDEYRIAKLAEMLHDLGMIQHGNTFMEPIRRQYMDSMSKAGTVIQNIPNLTAEQKQERLNAENRKVLETNRTASEYCAALSNIADEIKGAINTELNINTDHKRRLLRLEEDMERAEKRRRLDLMPEFSIAYVDYILLDFVFPLFWGVLGGFAGWRLLSRNLNSADIVAVVLFSF